MAGRTEPGVRLHRVSLRERQQREIPHRMVPHTGRLGPQHHLGDLRHLECSQLVPGMNAKIAERDDRGGLCDAGDEMGVVAT